MRKIKLALSALIISILSLAFVASPLAMAQDAKTAVCEGAGLISTGGTCGTSDPDPKPVESLIAKSLNLFSAIIGIIAVVMIMVAGLRFITSGGDAAGTGAARNTIIYAMVGLLVVALAQFFVRFVLARVS